MQRAKSRANTVSRTPAKYQPEQLPHTTVGADHRNIAFHCASCDRKLCRGSDIIRMGDTAFYVDLTDGNDAFCVFGKPKLNIYKHITTRSVSCQQCKSYLGHYYPHQPDDEDAGPCCKLFYFDQKRNQHSMYIPWSKAVYEDWLQKMSPEVVATPLDDLHAVEDAFASRLKLSGESRAAVEANLKARKRETVERIALGMQSGVEDEVHLSARHAPVLAEFDWSVSSSKTVRDFIAAYLLHRYSVRATWAIDAPNPLVLNGVRENTARATSFLRNSLMVVVRTHDFLSRIDERTQAAIVQALDDCRPELRLNGSKTSAMTRFYESSSRLKFPMSTTVSRDGVIWQSLKPFENCFREFQEIITTHIRSSQPSHNDYDDDYDDDYGYDDDRGYEDDYGYTHGW